MPTVEVMIPTTGERKSLIQAVLSALSQKGVDDLRVTVCLDNPDPDAETLARVTAMTCGARVVRTPQKFGRGGRVKAWYIQQSDPAKYVKFLDDDDWLAPSCVATMLAAMQAKLAATLALCQMVVLVAPQGVVLASRVSNTLLRVGVGSGQAMVLAAAGKDAHYYDTATGDYDWLNVIAARGCLVEVPCPLYVYNAYRSNSQRNFTDA